MAFIMIDGMDGSGKGTIIRACKRFLEQSGKTVFDLQAFTKTHNRFPTLDEIGEVDILLSAEPTSIHVGKVIREELIRSTTSYSGLLVAHAFSLDRAILYKNIILPALAKGITVIQDRGVTTSLVYQPLQDAELTVDTVCSLPGNALALSHVPDLLLVTVLDPQIAVQRATKRMKDDDAIFETITFQQQVKDVYESSWFSELFSTKGSKVMLQDTGIHNIEKNISLALEQITPFL